MVRRVRVSVPGVTWVLLVSNFEMQMLTAPNVLAKSKHESVQGFVQLRIQLR